MNRRTFLERFGAAGAVVALAACGSTSAPDERRFANQPTPTGDLVDGVTPTKAPLRPTATSATSLTHDALMQVRGSVTRIVLLDDSRCWSISSNGVDAIQFGPGSRESFVNVAATPTGSSIATIAAAADGSEVISIRDASGVETRKIPVPAGKGGIPPTPSGGVRLAWNASGDQLLFAKTGGGIERAGAAGDPNVMVSSAQAANPGSLVWSPRGDAIAFVSRRTADASDGLFVGSASSLPVDAAELVKPNSQARSIPQIAWLQDGMRIIFTQRTLNPTDGLSGDLFEVMASGDNARLLISAGLAAPVSAIGIFAVSPGSEAIAFTAWVPNGAGVAFHSLWVKPLEAGDAVRIDVSVNVAVTGLWWTDAGLVWREQIGTLNPNKVSGDFELRRLSLDGKGVQIFASKSVNLATPIASPVASPVASPKASPAAH